MKRFVLAFLLMAASCSRVDFKEVTCFSEALPVWEEGREREPNEFLTFKAEITVKDSLTEKSIQRLEDKCLVRLAASTDYRLKVNGEFVSHGPCVAAHGFYRIDAYSIAKFLKKGVNDISIEVAGYNTPSYYLLNQPSFLQAEVLYKGKVAAATGVKGFTAVKDKSRKPDAPRFSFQRPTGEAYTLPASDPEECGNVVLAVQESKTLISRHVPYPDYRIHEAQAMSGDMYRFKCNSSGFLGLEFTVTAPVTLHVAFDEILDEEGKIDEKRLTCNPFIDFDITQSGSYRFESFEPYTMQYASISCSDSSALTINRMYMRDYCNSDVWKAEFESDSPALDRLFETARETIRQSSLDVFMDTPSRERAGWLCDSYFSSRVTFDFSGHTLLEDNFLSNFLLPEKFNDIDEGMLPMCYPSDHWNHNYIPNWAMWFVLEMEEYYHRTGKRDVVDNAKERIYKLIDFFSNYLNSDGLLEKLPKWVFVEWSAANSFVQDVSYPSNMLYSGMLDAAGRLYGDSALIEQAAAVRETVRKQSFDGKFFCDNAIRGEDGSLTRTDNHTEVCQYYAFFFNVADFEKDAGLWNTLKTEFGPVRKTCNLHPDVPFANAFIGNYLRLELLSREGLSKQLIDEVIDEYTKMAELTGTLWEHMSTTASCNHGFASHIAHILLRDILGVYNVDPVNQTVTLRIQKSDVHSCRGKIPVGDEFICLDWTSDEQGNMTSCHIKVPRGWRIENM